MNFKLIDSKVTEILNTLTEVTLPIKVEDIAKKNGLRIMSYPLEQDVSGILVINNGKGIIGYNEKESRVRRRFTIAHELGHFFLHSNKASLFVDKQFTAFRSSVLNNETEKIDLEREANAFAASLLMPENFLTKEVETIKIDFGNEEGIKKLSKKFDVSSTAMYYRLTNLHLL